MRQQIRNLFFALVLLLHSTAPPAFAQTTPEEKIRQRVVEWGPNKVVSVQLKSGEKINGRVAEIKNDTLSIQFVKDNKIATRDLRWDEIKKVSPKNSTEDKVRKTSGFVALGMLAMLVVVIGVALTDPNF